MYLIDELHYVKSLIRTLKDESVDVYGFKTWTINYVTLCILLE